MVRSLLIRGMLIGAVAGIFAFATASVWGEPQVQAAINFEEQQAAKAEPPAHASDGVEIVGRSTQRTTGLLAGTVVMGVALGGLFALTFAWAHGRAGRGSARATSAMLALVAFIAVTVVPFTKYPANPPAVSNPATLDRRTLLFVAMLAISIVALIAATRVRRDLMMRLGGWNATVAAAAVFMVLIAVAQVLLPAVHEMPSRFPADVLYRFRLASIAISATMWTVVGLGFGVVAERLLKRASPQSVAIVGT